MLWNHALERFTPPLGLPYYRSVPSGTTASLNAADFGRFTVTRVGRKADRWRWELLDGREPQSGGQWVFYFPTLEEARLHIQEALDRCDR